MLSEENVMLSEENVMLSEENVMLSEENVMLSEENVMLSEAERSRSISRVVVIKRYCNEASEMLRLRSA